MEPKLTRVKRPLGALIQCRQLSTFSDVFLLLAKQISSESNATSSFNRAYILKFSGTATSCLHIENSWQQTISSDYAGPSQRCIEVLNNLPKPRSHSSQTSSAHQSTGKVDVPPSALVVHRQRAPWSPRAGDLKHACTLQSHHGFASHFSCSSASSWQDCDTHDAQAAHQQFAAARPFPALADGNRLALGPTRPSAAAQTIAATLRHQDPRMQATTGDSSTSTPSSNPPFVASLVPLTTSLHQISCWGGDQY